jgi:hypothetical protein
MLFFSVKIIRKKKDDILLFFNIYFMYVKNYVTFINEATKKSNLDKMLDFFDSNSIDPYLWKQNSWEIPKERWVLTTLSFIKFILTENLEDYFKDASNPSDILPDKSNFKKVEDFINYNIRKLSIWGVSEIFKPYQDLARLYNKKKNLESSHINLYIKKTKPVFINFKDDDIKIIYDYKAGKLLYNGKELYSEKSDRRNNNDVYYNYIYLPIILYDRSITLGNIEENVTFVFNGGSQNNGFKFVSTKVMSKYKGINIIEKVIEEIKEVKSNLSKVTYDYLEYLENNIEQIYSIFKEEKTKFNKYQKILNSGMSEDEYKEMEKAKRDKRNQEKKNKEEADFNDFLKNNNVPNTIEEFNKRNSIKSNDLAVNDVVLFSEPYYIGSYPNAKYEGDRTILGVIRKESYGSKKGQHTFTIYVLDSDYYNEGDILRRKGRNIYKNNKTIQLSTEKEREEKHNRGKSAKENKYWQWWHEYTMGNISKLDKIPKWFLDENDLKV